MTRATGCASSQPVALSGRLRDGYLSSHGSGDAAEVETRLPTRALDPCHRDAESWTLPVSICGIRWKIDKMRLIGASLPVPLDQAADLLVLP